MCALKEEKTAGDTARTIELLKELDSDYPYSCIQTAKEGKFNAFDKSEMEKIKKILSLKFLLYSPLKCMYIIKILEENKEFQKPGKILSELRKRGLVTKKMNGTDFKEKYLENLVYFGFLETSGKMKGRRYKISSEFNTLKHHIPPVLFWLIENEPCYVDQIWNITSEFNRRFGKVKYISKNGEEYEDFDILKVIYSLMSCKASCEDSREILRKMEIEDNFHSGMSKNRIVFNLIQVAGNLEFQEIREEMVKKASEFLDLVFIDGKNQGLLDNDVVKQVIEDYLKEQRLIISKKLSKDLSGKVLGFLITNTAKEGIAEVKKDRIIEGMKYVLFEELQIDIEDLGSELKKILASIRYGMENPNMNYPLYSLLVGKISYYFLVKNRFVIHEEDAQRELVADLTRNLPGEGASDYKDMKIEIIKSIEQEIKTYLENVNEFVKLLQFSEKGKGKGTELLDEKYRVLEQFLSSVLENEKGKPY